MVLADTRKAWPFQLHVPWNVDFARNCFVESTVWIGHDEQPGFEKIQLENSLTVGPPTVFVELTEFIAQLTGLTRATYSIQNGDVRADFQLSAPWRPYLDRCWLSMHRMGRVHHGTLTFDLPDQGIRNQVRSLLRRDCIDYPFSFRGQNLAAAKVLIANCFQPMLHTRARLETGVDVLPIPAMTHGSEPWNLPFPSDAGAAEDLE